MSMLLGKYWAQTKDIYVNKHIFKQGVFLASWTEQLRDKAGWQEEDKNFSEKHASPSLSFRKWLSEVYISGSHTN